MNSNMYISIVNSLVICILGFTQKEKAKLKTVRDVKKNEIERRRREGFESLDNHPLSKSNDGIKFLLLGSNN